MKRSAAARFFTVLIALTLFAGVEAKATGIGSCPMHQAAAHDHAHHHHHGHAGGKTVACNCLDACQTGAQPALAPTDGFRRVAEISAPAKVAAPSVEIRAALTVRTHLLPFPNAPPFPG